MFRNLLRPLWALIQITVLVASLTAIDRASAESPAAPSTSVGDEQVVGYTNPAGLVENLCNGKVGVTASNMPYRDQVEDFQPVKFTVVSVGKNTGTRHVLDTFTLPNRYKDGEYYDTIYRTYKVNRAGVVSLQVDGKNVARPLHYTRTCAKSKNHPSTVLPNTGK